MTARLLVDMTQFVHQPRATGIQRVLLAVADGLAPDGVQVEPAARVDGRYLVVDREDAADLLRWQFEHRGPGPGGGSVRDAWVRAARRHVAPGRVPVEFEAVLLAELTTTAQTLADVRRWHAAGTVAVALYYDSLPLLRPAWFGGWDQVGADDYYRTVAGLDAVAFISRAVRDEFELRVARRPVPVAGVAFPGVDQVVPDHRPPVEPARFVMVGAVEPRKRTDVVAAAARRLRAAGTPVELVVVGGVSTTDRGFVASLRDDAADSVLTWREDASDAVVADLVAGASAVVYAGEHEGYGLPPLEALRTGVPCITTRGLPSVEAVDGDGLLLLERFDVAAVAGAMATAARPDSQTRLRAAARAARTPTWSAFCDSLGDVVGRALDHRGVRPGAQS